MSKKHFLIYILPLLIIILALILFVFFWPATKPSQPADKTDNAAEIKINRLPEGQCLEKWLINRSFATLISEVKGKDYVEGDVIKAKQISPEKYHSFHPQAVADWKTDKTTTFFWIDRDKKEMLVDGQYFSDLKVVDAVDLPESKEEQVIGRFFLDHMPLAQRQLAELLIRAEIIQTYEHLGTWLCLKEEIEKGDVYVAVFHGEHTLCTNACYTGEYDFGVKIDWSKGEIILVNKKFINKMERGKNHQ